AKTINGEVQLHAQVDGKKIVITKGTVRRDLQLEDAEGIDCLPNSTIFKQLALMGAKTTAWNEFSSTMASAIICLATNKKFNFSKYIFESMMKNLDNLSSKFLMCPRLVQVFLEKQLDEMSAHKRIYIAPSRTKKIFKNMRRVGIDEFVHKERGDCLVRAATIASRLEAEQDNGNITKTQSKATPNESSSLGTTLGCGPRCQETMGDTIAQTSGINKTKTTQGNEIATLKRRVKKLEKRNRSRTHKLKRLYKVGLTARVESSGYEGVLGEDASKYRRRINDINEDEDITLVSVQDDADAEMFDVNTLIGDEVFVEREVDAKDVNLTVDEVALAQAIQELKSTKPKAKGITFREPGESTITTTPIPSKDDIQAKVDVDYQLAERLQDEEQEQFIIEEKSTFFKELLEQRRKHFAAKRAEEKRNKPPTKSQHKKTMITYLKNMEGWKHKDLKSKDFDSIKELFDKAFKRVNMFKDFRTDLVEVKVDDDQEAAKIKELMEIVPDEEEVAIDAIPLAVKSSRIVDWKIHKEGKKSYYQIIRADRKSQVYLVFSHMLKSFDMEDLEDLYKLSMQIYMLVEKKYPLTPPTLSQMLEKKLQIDYQSEMAYQLCKLIIKQLKKQ
ncbi:hypothetical protein Tco_0897973, partial [Tanacetum coccineum]